MNTLRPGLPPVPRKMAALPVDERGYPVPYFVAWVDGKPDHRIADARAKHLCVTEGRCWLCGGFLGRFQTFCVGPMCTITRTSAEPPQHLECALYAAMSCPFLTRPHAKRRDANMPDGHQAPPGEFLRRNPGAVCVWVTLHHQPYRHGDGVLFHIGEPSAMHWFAEGREATRAEIDASITEGLPALQEVAASDGEAASRELQLAVDRLRQLLDRALPSTGTAPDAQAPATEIDPTATET